MTHGQADYQIIIVQMNFTFRDLPLSSRDQDLSAGGARVIPGDDAAASYPVESKVLAFVGNVSNGWHRSRTSFVLI